MSQPDPPHRFGDALDPTTPDDAWDTLRWHLEATWALPTVVVLGFESPSDKDLLRRRTTALAKRRTMAVTRRTARDFPPWAAHHLPQAGLLWLDLMDASPQDTTVTLATLNELRGRLHRPDSGALVVSTRWSAVAEMARFAGDFWAVVSFVVHVARRVVSDETDLVRTLPSVPERAVGLSLPPSYRSESGRALIRLLQRALDLSDDDPAAAAALLGDRPTGDQDSLLDTLLVETVRAAVVGQHDPATTSRALSRALDALHELDPRDRDLLGLERVVRALLLARCGPAATLPFDVFAVEVARDLSTGTTDATADLSAADLAQALENVAQVSIRLGRLDAASDAYSESSHLRRNLVDANPNPVSTRQPARDADCWAARVDSLLGASSHPASDLAETVRHQHLRLRQHQVALRLGSDLAEARGDAGDPAGAVAGYEEVLADQLRVLGPDHPDTLRNRDNLAYWHGRAGDPAGAAAELEPLLADQLRVLGPDHPDTTVTRSDLAYWRGKAGDPTGAVTGYERLLADQLRALGPDHPHALLTRHRLARWYGEAGDPARAVAEYRLLLADRERVLGPDHPDTQRTRGDLADWQRRQPRPRQRSQG